MNQETRSENGISILMLNGRFDNYQTGKPKAWVEQKTKTTPAHLVVNLAGVNFIDSTGLATLVQGMKRARQQQGDLYLCCLQPPVRMVFELTRLDKAFAIFVNEEDALKAFDNA
ncbi:MAG: STAS domain-containing protein [Anaerolineales bacterium]|nr:STAS domain-containing protein [Anaerolineales bacterium]